MTFSYKKVYIENTSTITGPYEGKGPLKEYFDKSYNDLYNGAKTFEQAEAKLLKESIEILLEKSNKTEENIDLIIGGDLLNQITASSYGTEEFNKPFLGIYGACSTSVEGITIASSLIDSNRVDNVVVAVSSHNMSSEKQFRNPTEYGAPKPKTATFTATGGASILLTDKKTNIRVESSTVGKITNAHIKDPFNMGAVMAPAAADTIYNHLKDTNRTIDYYDLVLTGDLGVYGKEILIDLMHQDYGIDISKNYDDCGTMLYDLKKQKEVMAGGSGPVCSALVNYSYILDEMKKKNLKKVLLVATGAMFSPTFVYQKQDILSTAHAVSLEVV